LIGLHGERARSIAVVSSDSSRSNGTSIIQAKSFIEPSTVRLAGFATVTGDISANSLSMAVGPTWRAGSISATAPGSRAGSECASNAQRRTGAASVNLDGGNTVLKARALASGDSPFFFRPYSCGLARRLIAETCCIKTAARQDVCAGRPGVTTP